MTAQAIFHVNKLYINRSLVAPQDFITWISCHLFKHFIIVGHLSLQFFVHVINKAT